MTTPPTGSPLAEYDAGSRWRLLGPVFAVAWLVFLIQPVQAAAERHSWRGDAAILVLGLFSLAYLAAAVGMTGALRTGKESDIRRGLRMLRIALVAMAALSAAVIGLIDHEGLATLPYLAVVGSIAFGRYGGAWVAIVGVAAALLSRAHGGAWDSATGLATGTVSAGLSVWVFALLTQRQRARVRATEAEAALALETQRGRFARDLHDVVGHSLSVVTMKAGVARRLLDVDLDRARVELEDLERLSREALDDVRRAVGGYRDISLPGELARAREVLAAAGIEAEVPSAADDVDPRLRELFAWAVREGVTNVVRHSRARHCWVGLERRRLTVEDDGYPSPIPTTSVGGHGLLGLTERAAAVGAVVVSETLEPHGFRLGVIAKEIG